jgi:hypothetical protein
MINKKAQEEKIFSKNLSKLRFKKAQEEIVGFGIILIVIAVVLLVFLGFGKNHNQKQTLEDFESTSFLKAFLGTTTNCENNGNYVLVKDLVFECLNEYKCDNGLDSCNVLNEVSQGAMASGWSVGPEMPFKGYELHIDSNEGSLVNITKGNNEGQYKGAIQDYAKSSTHIEAYVKIYY